MHSFLLPGDSQPLAKVSLNISQSQMAHLALELQRIVSLDPDCSQRPLGFSGVYQVLSVPLPWGLSALQKLYGLLFGDLGLCRTYCVFSQPLVENANWTSCLEAPETTVLWLSHSLCSLARIHRFLRSFSQPLQW